LNATSFARGIARAVILSAPAPPHGLIFSASGLVSQAYFLAGRAVARCGHPSAVAEG